MKSRWYDPAIGRFISADTILPDPTNPQAYNRYSYVYNNPIKYVDPDGHMPQQPIANIDGDTKALGTAATLYVLGYALGMNMDRVAAYASGALEMPNLVQMSSGNASNNYQKSRNLLSGHVSSTPPPQWDPDNDPNKNQWGTDREDYIRDFLRNKEKWKIESSSDAQVRTQLNIPKGQRVSDFVGQKNGNYLVAESKGTKIGRAIEQLENTVDGLFRTYSNASANNTQARIYVNQSSWTQLNGQGFSNYRVRQGILEIYDDIQGQWTSQQVRGVQVHVFPVP